MSIYYSETGQNAVYYTEKVCPVCNKTFCIPHKDNWAYKRTNQKITQQKRGTLFFDRYSCLTKYEKRLEESRANERQAFRISV